MAVHIEAVSAPASSSSIDFVLEPGDKHSEVGRNLAAPVPRALSWVDQIGLWSNLGVSLLGFTGAIFVLHPNGTSTPVLTLTAGLTAIVVGTLLGTLPIALAGVAGAQTGAPAMVLLRGLFGKRLSYLPTVVNILQCIGWGIFELVTIATAAHTIAPALPRWGYVTIGGVLTAVLAVWPLGFIRTLRRYVTPVVVVVLVWLFIQVMLHPLHAPPHSGWTGFWTATDTVVAAAVSFAPLAADYTRHSRSSKAAFGGAMIGYSVTQVLCYVIGLLALLTVARSTGLTYGELKALPVGLLCLSILAARELDQSFANVYSTAVSTQNLRPLWDRRVLAIGIAALCTAAGIWLTIADYENFLFLLGAVFVPMSAVLIVDYFIVSAGRYNVTNPGRWRWLMVLPWAAGFVTYQLINPGLIGWWVSMWGHVDSWLHFRYESWMSASILSFVVAGAATLLGGLAVAAARRLAPGRRAESRPASAG